MFDLTLLSEPYILLFSLIFLRMMAFTFSSALFGLQSVSISVKVLLALSLASLTFPVVKSQGIYTNEILNGFSENIIFLASKELITGLVIGFLTRLFFFAVSMTGDLVSVYMGLSNAQLFNPMTNSTGNSMEQFHTLMGVLVLLAINGHHSFISGIFQSYELIPVSVASLKVGSLAEVAYWAQEVLVMAIKMSAPMLVAIITVNIAMAILARVVPQINVLITGAPITFGIGIVLLIICMPLWVLEMNGILDVTTEKLITVLKSL